MCNINMECGRAIEPKAEIADYSIVVLLPVVSAYPRVNHSPRILSEKP